MFRIGEFSKIAQVSGRLLRYYDEIGLLKPHVVDKWTSYRYYTADQLPRLNRILALRELGLSLEQIQHMLDDNIDTGDIRDLYLRRKAEIEQALRDELARLQQVQLRLEQLDSLERDWMPDVVIKQLPEQPVLSHHDRQMTAEQLYQLFDRLSQGLPVRTAEKSKYGSLFTILYSDVFVPEEDLDLEIGVLLNDTSVAPMEIGDDVRLTLRTLPAVEHMATIVHQGLADHPITYNALGRWLEEHQYRIVGNGREILLENHYPTAPEKCIMEIQFPIERIDLTRFDFLDST